VFDVSEQVQFSKLLNNFFQLYIILLWLYTVHNIKIGQKTFYFFDNKYTMLASNKGYNFKSF